MDAYSAKELAGQPHRHWLCPKSDAEFLADGRSPSIPLPDPFASESRRSRVGEDSPLISAVLLGRVLRDINQQEMTMTTKTHSTSEPVRPTFAAYHVTETADGRKRWNRIGAYFAHRDGRGGSLVLGAIPIAFDGRIVLRAPKRTTA